MMKALLIVTALSGADYQVEMPSMESCLKARTSITEQNVNINTLCIPKERDIKINDDYYGFKSSFDRETNSRCRCHTE